MCVGGIKHGLVIGRAEIPVQAQLFPEAFVI